MCGRLTLSYRDLDAVADELDALAGTEAAASYRPRFNVAPTDRHPIVRLTEGGGQETVRRLEMAGWGFRRAERPPLFNARAETAAWKDSFRAAFAHGRCLVPADGFYEWSGEGEARRPLWLHRADGKLLLMAGLYEEAPADPAEQARPLRFTILTTAPNQMMSSVHDRMPALLSPQDALTWLQAGDTRARAALLRPAPEDWLIARPVSRRVNSVRNDDPECLQPWAEPPEEAAGLRPGRRQLELF